jgi:hypothetical protein
MEATKDLEPAFKKALKRNNWRTTHFVEGKIPYGVENFSAGWFGQAHHVCSGYMYVLSS